MTKFYQNAFRCSECYRLGWERKIPNKDICPKCVEENHSNWLSSVGNMIGGITSSIANIFVSKSIQTVDQ